MKVLIVEDEPNVARVVDMMLQMAGFATTTTAFGEEAVDLAKHYAFDIILLDLNLPDIHGFEVLRRLREMKNMTPALVLSGDGTDDRMLRSFGLGADDFLTKPYRAAELVARIRAVIRRTNGFASPALRVGEIEIDLEKRQVKAGSTILDLTQREYQIIEVLALRKGATVSKEFFLNSIYGGKDEPGTKIIDVYVCKLRKKISDALGDGQYISTDWGRGYSLREPARRAPVPQAVPIPQAMPVKEPAIQLQLGSRSSARVGQ